MYAKNAKNIKIEDNTISSISIASEGGDLIYISNTRTGDLNVALSRNVINFMSTPYSNKALKIEGSNSNEKAHIIVESLFLNTNTYVTSTSNTIANSVFKGLGGVWYIYSQTYSNTYKTEFVDSGSSYTETISLYGSVLACLMCTKISFTSSTFS